MADEHHHHHHHHHDEPDRPGRAGPVPGAPSDPGQEALVKALHSSFHVLRVLMVVLVVLYLLSGGFWIDPGQQALIARLGVLRTQRTPEGETPIFREGFHWALPDPFDTKFLITSRLQELRVTSFLFNHPEAAISRDLSQIVGGITDINPGVDGVMLTGDRNLSHGRWEVQYQITDAAAFVQNVGTSPNTFAPLLQRLTESAVLDEVAGRTVEQVTRTALEAVRDGVRRRLQKMLDELHTGVQVAQVVAYTIEPGPVRQAFIDVVRAENERLAMQQQAEEQAAAALNRAAGDRHRELLEKIEAYGAAQLAGAGDDVLSRRLEEIDATLDRAKAAGAGQVAVVLNEAEARAEELVQGLRREFEEYQRYVEQLRTHPLITKLALWVQMRKEILSNRQNEISVVPDAQELQIHIESDPERRLELEEEQMRKRLQGG